MSNRILFSALLASSVLCFSAAPVFAQTTPAVHHHHHHKKHMHHHHMAKHAHHTMPARAMTDDSAATARLNHDQLMNGPGGMPQ